MLGPAAIGWSKQGSAPIALGFAIRGLSQNGPWRDVVLATRAPYSGGTVGPVGKRERSECGGKGVSVHTYSRTQARIPTTPWPFASLHGHPVRRGGAANQSFLRGTRWSTTLKAVVAVKEEGRRAAAGEGVGEGTGAGG